MLAAEVAGSARALVGRAGPRAMVRPGRGERGQRGCEGTVAVRGTWL